jgi:putative ABC transport system ATP-binding protein
MNAPTLSVSHLTKRFGAAATEVVAVRDVSLEIAPGEVVLIMGPSGSGKTTLLLMLGALLRASEGEIRLDGEVLTQLPERKLPSIRLRRFGFIFQDFNLLSALTAIENVAIVAELAGMSSKVARARATKLLTDLGLASRLHFLPEKLSVGEKQRVAVSRALVNDPTFILDDEPTANLDSKIGHEIMRLLRSIAKDQGRSVLIVSHDQRIKDIADRVLWLEDGQFKESTAMLVDPVCQMRVEQASAVVAVWDDEAFAFCSRGCRDEFLAAPYRFFPDAAASGPHETALRAAVRHEAALAGARK